MIFSKNVKMHLITGRYEISIVAPELEKLHKKYGGMVHIEIKKPQDDKTEQQMKALHSLLSAFFFSGMSSAPDDIKDPEQFKRWAKSQWGVFYVETINNVTIKTLESVAKYTKFQLSDFIDKTIKVIEISGAINDPKIQEILKGIEENSLSGES